MRKTWICVLVAISVACFAEAQSLAEVAKKEKERRKKNDVEGVEVKTFSGEATPATKDELTDEVVPERADFAQESREESKGKAVVAPTAEEDKKDQAERVAPLEKRLATVGQAAQGLLASFRRYIDGCYNKLTTQNTIGTGTGSGAGVSAGVVVGPDSFGAFASGSRFAWTESWVQSSSINNEETAVCRILWSDMIATYSGIKVEMVSIQEDARRAGVYPGTIRDLRAKYGLEWSGWER